MRASLDTNAIIHFYRANLQDILFDLFDEGLLIYEQIRMIELEHHGKDILESVDRDIASGKIELYTNEKLKELSVYKVFEYYTKENKNLYSPSDLGEIYAISLAQTLGAYSLVTDDIKQGGPYMSLLQFPGDVFPFTFSDILILRYLTGMADGQTTKAHFELINRKSELNWSFRSQIAKFIKRFWKEPYKEEEREWIDNLLIEKKIDKKYKLRKLSEIVD